MTHFRPPKWTPNLTPKMTDFGTPKMTHFGPLRMTSWGHDPSTPDPGDPWTLDICLYGPLGHPRDVQYLTHLDIWTPNMVIPGPPTPKMTHFGHFGHLETPDLRICPDLISLGMVLLGKGPHLGPLLEGSGPLPGTWDSGYQV